MLITVINLQMNNWGLTHWFKLVNKNSKIIYIVNYNINIWIIHTKILRFKNNYIPKLHIKVIKPINHSFIV